MKYKWLPFLGLWLLPMLMAVAQEGVSPDDTLAVESDTTTVSAPAPVTNLEASDIDNDHGHAVVLHWDKSADDGSGDNSVLMYEIFRWVPHMVDSMKQLRSTISQKRALLESGETEGQDVKARVRELLSTYDEFVDSLPVAHAAYPENGDWRFVNKVPAGTESFEHKGTKDRLSQDYIPDHTDLYYRVDAVTADTTVRTPSEIAGPVQSSGQVFNTGRTIVFVFVLVFCILTMWFVQRARRGADLYVRPIGGIEAVDDAIGRATEMGRPILYVLGLGTAADVATIASFTILGRVAKRVAEYQTELIVPTYDPIVMSVAQEVVKSAYLDAGRADAYNEDIVFFVTQSQFAYVAAVNGIMLRQLPATNVYMGMFHAESLLLAETGAEAGSIQISGTDQIAQLPFFIVACDYTLIGEELYAASAYLGREPILLGSLKAQDYAKAAVIVFAIVGLVLSQFDLTFFIELFQIQD